MENTVTLLIRNKKQKNDWLKVIEDTHLPKEAKNFYLQEIKSTPIDGLFEFDKVFLWAVIETLESYQHDSNHRQKTMRLEGKKDVGKREEKLQASYSEQLTKLRALEKELNPPLCR